MKTKQKIFTTATLVIVSLPFLLMMTAVASAQTTPIYATEEISVVPNPPEAGEPTEICYDQYNPTSSPVDIQLQFSWAQLGIGIPFTPISGPRSVHLPPFSIVSECIHWIPPLSGPVCIQVEIIRTGYETVWAQHNLDIDGSLLPGVPRLRTFPVGNPTVSPVDITLGLIQHLPQWNLELSQEELYDMAPGEVRTVTLTVTPTDFLPQNGTVIVDVEGYGAGELLGGFRKVYRCGDRPHNFLCELARELPGDPGIHESRIEVTDTPSNPESWCEQSNIGHGVWFWFIPTINGIATFTTCHPNTAYDTVVRASIGGCGGIMADLSCNDDTIGEDCFACGMDNRGSRISFAVNAGQQYYLEVGAYNDNTAGCELCLGTFLTIENDGDGIPDDFDNCPETQNGPYAGTCIKDSVGTPCMGNEDCGAEGFCSMNQEDTDGDGVGDLCDECTDTDYDSYGNPGFPNICEMDNCPEHHNPEQVDTFPPQRNGCGDACECEGNFDGDEDQDGSDAFTFKVDFGRSPFGNPCIPDNPCNGNFNCDEDVDGSDAFIFKEDFGRSPFGNPCPNCVTIPWCI